MEGPSSLVEVEGVGAKVVPSYLVGVGHASLAFFDRLVSEGCVEQMQVASLVEV